MPRDVVPIFRSPAPRLGEQVEIAVVRQDQVRLVADDEPAADVDAGPCQLVDSAKQRLRIDDDAVADDAGDAGVENAGRNQPEDELRAVDVDRVAGVVAALIARDDVEPRRQQIDDLALAFVAPLGAEHCEIHDGRLRFYSTRARQFVDRHARRCGDVA